MSITEVGGQYAYTPKSMTVGVGETVTWTNDSDAPHTVDADDGSFESDTFNENGTFAHTFSSAGTFAYHCDIHSYMQGTVVVTATAATPATGGTPPATDTDAPAIPWSEGPMWLLALVFGTAALVTGATIARRSRAR